MGKNVQTLGKANSRRKYDFGLTGLFIRLDAICQEIPLHFQFLLVGKYKGKVRDLCMIKGIMIRKV